MKEEKERCIHKGAAAEGKLKLTGKFQETVFHKLVKFVSAVF